MQVRFTTLWYAQDERKRYYPFSNPFRYVLKNNFTHFSNFCLFLSISTHFYTILSISTHSIPNSILISIHNSTQFQIRYDVITYCRIGNSSIEYQLLNFSFRLFCLFVLFCFLLVENPFTSTKPNIETSIR